MKAKTYTAKQADEKAAEIESKCSAYDFDPRQLVRVVSQEGYDAEIPSAFVLEYGDWVLVFAEHHKPIAHHKDELVMVEVRQISNYAAKLTQADKFKPKKIPVSKAKKKGVKS